jgi:hypothetical protein
MIDFVKGKIDFLDFDEVKSLDEFFDSFERENLNMYIDKQDNGEVYTINFNDVEKNRDAIIWDYDVKNDKLDINSIVKLHDKNDNFNYNVSSNGADIVVDFLVDSDKFYSILFKDVRDVDNSLGEINNIIHNSLYINK